MPKVAIYNIEAKKIEDLDLNEKIFAVKPKESVIHQVYVSLLSNARQPWAHTKDRSEVRGGGRKPWRQKGTGRARHGSIRSPLWTGGGVTFGPRKDRNYKQKINKKMSRQAIAMCLSDKIKNEQLLILDKMVDDTKTKTLFDLRKKLPGFGKTTLFVSDKKDKNLLLAAKNIEKVDVSMSMDLNVVDLMHHGYIIFSKKALEVLEKRLTKKKV